MTLLEVMVVGAIGATVAAATTVNIVEQVRRVKAVDAARGALHPHTVARDRAVASRLCTETIMVPSIGQPFMPPAENPPERFPADAQRASPRLAVLEWSDCTGSASLLRVDFFDLEGDITLAPYNSIDGRAVFGPDGGLTDERPGAAGSSFTALARVVCRTPPIPEVLLEGIAEGEGEGAEGEGEGGRGRGAEDSCEAEPPVAEQAPPEDVDFSATTYFGTNENYRIYARVGATEHLE